MLRVEKTVFLSYRRTNFPWAIAIYQCLTRYGFDVFFDYNSVSSGDFERVILENIRARAHFLVLLTPLALKRCDDPKDWLRREIEEAIACRRNVVPLMLDGFDFGAPEMALHLTGDLVALNRYNGLRVPAEYFDAAMEKLRDNFLNVPLDAVLHPASGFAQGAAKKQQVEAVTDGLTGLFNRREFENRMESALKQKRAGLAEYAVCYVDLDQFKMVNGAYGHAAGDALLRQVGALLKSNVRLRDTVARLAGDDFGILLAGCSVDEATKMAEGFREAVGAAKFEWEERVLGLSASIGVVSMSDSNVDVASVLNAVEIACQAAKEAGRNRVHTFRENDLDLMRRCREMQWAARINNSLEEGRFELFRETILSLRGSQSTNHYEILLRMRDEAGEIVLPEHFIAVAEKCGTAGNIDRWVIENTFRWLKSETDEREKLTMCSINLSGQSLQDDKFLSFVTDQFHNSGLDAGKVCFEIPESFAIAQFAQAIHCIHRLKELGCKFALDNFGTGLSSFGYLKHFPVDFLKIDGSFVREILVDSMDREMVRSINEISHLTGKRSIAVSAESQEIINVLREYGVDYAQGNGVSQPQFLLKGP